MKRTRMNRQKAGLWASIFACIAAILVLVCCISLAANNDPPTPPVDTTDTESDIPVISPVTDEETTDQTTSPPETSPPATTSPPETDPPVTDPPETEPPLTYKDVTLLSAGDIMFHNPNLKAAQKDDGSYDFTPFFSFLGDIVGRYDYAVANLETTLAGPDYDYTPSGGISFSTPDSALDAIKSAGFDMMLFANNHSYDRGIHGIKRTVNHLRENEMEVIGARSNKEDTLWRVVDIGGVKVGMVNYTNDGTWSTSASGTINGITLKEDHADYLSLFYLNDLETFYDRVKTDLADMKAAGAQLNVIYIHWGPEYYTDPRDNTKQIAQMLCDLGADAIIGSHPHVIQPMETLTSTLDPSHKAVCFYSLGNFISNQNRLTLSEDYCKGNNKQTENGVMVVLTIRQYSTGEVFIASIETIPTWVHRYYDEDWHRTYRIVPLAAALSDPEKYGLNDSDFGLSHATQALKMTTDLLDEAVQAFNQSINLPTG